MKKHKRKIIYLHLIALAIILLNYIIDNYFKYSLENNTILIIKIIYYFSGATLYFFYKEKLTEISFYFGIFVWLPVVTVVGWITLYIGMFLTFLYLNFFCPFDKYKQLQDYNYYRETGSFLSVSKKIKVTQNVYYFLEKEIARIELEHEESENLHIVRDNQELYLKYHFIDYSTRQEKDTLIKIK